MTQEEKAKTYDETLERAKECLKDGTITTIARDYIWEIFPELQESEDEKIRKELIAHFRNTRCVTEEGAEKIAQWVAWLEKQGEKKPNEWHCEDEQCIGCINDKGCVTCVDDNMKETNGKPKFKVGDWLQYRNAKPFFVEEITKQGYINGVSCLPFEWEDEIHLWTIQDAKDGDVLSGEIDGEVFVFLFNQIQDRWIVAHVYYSETDGEFIEKAYLHRYHSFSPATKEQHNLLFQKMKEAGYKWDNKKKELKRVESKTSLL